MVLSVARTGLTAMLGLWIVCASGSAGAQHGWPIDSTGKDHAIGNSFGQMEENGYVSCHTGIDILGNPKYNSDGSSLDSAPWVRVTVSGTASELISQEGSLLNGTTILGTDGAIYNYWHLQHNSYGPDYVIHYNNGAAVASNDRIAKLVRWACLFHHLHYEVVKGYHYLNPLADIQPNPDPDLPEIDSIGFAVDNSDPWKELKPHPDGQGSCTIVSGKTDVIVQVRDRDDAGSTLPDATSLWIYNLRWRACSEADPDCDWVQTYKFDSMPTAWYFIGNPCSAYYSNRAPWNSISDCCSDRGLYYCILTNFVDGAPNIAGAWDTLSIADGSYTVSVEATDFSGNVSVSSTRVCVENSRSCTIELTVRDASDDNGAIPYQGSNWEMSPDITASSVIYPGTTNQIDVRVWNLGSCDLPAGLTYEVCVGWGTPTIAFTYPLPPGQLIECKTDTVSPGGWMVGTNRVTTFTWTPGIGTVPRGDHSLLAWIDLLEDPVQRGAQVNWDDNQTMHKVAFKLAN